MPKIFWSVFIPALLLSLPVLAQTSTPEMAERLRADGKIWVVVTVIATIFAGIIAYLVRIDRKVARMERERRQKA
jgi:bacteriorhodopsin